MNNNGPSGVCQVEGCQKAWVMLMSGHKLCSAHSDKVIDWAREKNKKVDDLTSEEVVAIVEGPHAASSARRG